MDDLPKKGNQQESADQASGDIFKSDQDLGSSGETGVTQEPNQQDTVYQEPLSQVSSEVGAAYDQSASSSDLPPADEYPEVPPPFEQNKGKKYFIFAFLIIFILLIIFLIFRLIKGRSSSPPSSEKIELDYWGLWEEKEIVKVALDEYQKLNQNITINYTKQDPKQYRERLQAAIDRGEGPDVFRFHNTWIPMFTNHLSSMPKDIYSDEDFEKTFYPVATNDLKNGGNYYGIPLELDGLLLFYNEDIFKAANLSIPTTWVDVQNLVPKLTVKEKGKIVTSAVALGTAENIEHFSDILTLMMFQNGTRLDKSLFTCSDQTTNSCAVEALTFYRKFAEPPDNTWDETLDNSIIAFSSGKVGMIFAPSWQALVIKTINPDLNFKTTIVPQLPCDRTPCPSVNFASYWVEGVSTRSKFQKEAWEFLKYLSQSSQLQKLYAEQVKLRKLFGEPYSRVDLGKSIADNPYLAPIITSAPTMKSFYTSSRTFDGETGINTSLNNYLKDAVNSLSRGVSPETALQTADEGFKQVFSRFGLAAPSEPAQ